MLQISDLSKSFGPRTLFEGVSLKLNPRHRYGLVGANGAGKTTFLQILTGDEAATSGGVSVPKAARVGVLRQDRFLDERESVLRVCMAGDEEVFTALEELERLGASAAVDAERVAAVEELLSQQDGYTLQARASAVLVGLGLQQAELEHPLGTLSGGFRLRVQLARLLVGRPDVLLLDEPTNHLDILSIRWLEQFLKEYSGCAVVISHDHQFLNGVATDILDVDYGTISVYSGNYTAFVQQKAAFREQKEAEIARAEKAVAEKRAFVERFKAKATKARQAQSRVKQIEKIQIEDLPQTSRRAPHFQFETRRPSGRDVLSVDEVRRSFGDKRVLQGVGFTIRRSERVAVIGANGLGKSTLLKILVDRLPADAGSVTWGHETHLGYFAQDHKDLLSDTRHTPLSFAWDACPAEGTSFVRGYLGRMLFSGDDVDKSVDKLSGGEAARLIFCRIMIEKPNVLLLDEPTNHLDLESIEALVTALKRFDGTLIFVSHDRWFVSQLATRILEVTPSGLRDFAGTYSEYLAAAGADHLDQQSVAQRAKDEARQRKTEQRPEEEGLSWEERKRLKNRLKALPDKRDAVLERIAALEADLDKLREQYNDPEIFGPGSVERLGRVRADEAALTAGIEVSTQEWEQLEAELEELSSRPELQ